MKLYKIITEFQSYKWCAFAPFAVVFILGATLKLLGLNALIPTLIFLGMLILGVIIWIVGWISYKRFLQKRLDSWRDYDNCDDEFFDFI